MKNYTYITIWVVFHLSVLLSQFETSAQKCGDYVPCYSTLNIEDMDELPIIYVKVDFQFWEQSVVINGVEEKVNFQCSNPNDPYYAPDYVEQILIGANLVLANPDQSNQTSAQDLPHTQIQLIAYGDPEDLCDAIYIDEESPNDDVLHINFEDTGQIGFSGFYQGGNAITLSNIHKGVFGLGYSAMQVLPAGRVLLHEIGHYVGLCHSFSYENTCYEINPVAECSTAQFPTLPTCGADFCNGCCTDGHSNNVMSYGGQSALVFSQWVILYSTLSSDVVAYVDGDLEEVLDEFCECIEPNGAPLEISSEVEVWDTPQSVNSDIEILTGSTLILNSWLVMGKNKKIIVNRGARFFVQGGKIFGPSSDCRWGGILVHGCAKVPDCSDCMECVGQPSHEDAQDEYTELSSNHSGVVWFNNAELHWANTVVATKGSGNLSSWEYFGGLVMADDSDFYDNGRVAEFMRFNRANLSYFDDCTISSSETTPENSAQGLTIWGCENIKLTEVRFEGLREFAISGINFSTEMVQCTLDGFDAQQGIGFQTESSMPNSTLSRTTMDFCDFKNYGVGIVARSTSTFRTGLLITNTHFTEPASSFSRGILINGESGFDIILDNEFIDYRSSILATSTGENPNYIRCNILDNMGEAVRATGLNSALEVLDNEFIGTAIPQIRVSGSENFPGSIGALQGSLSVGASNCFANTNTAIAAVPAQTIPFEYFVYDLNGDPENCEVPTNNQSDNGFHNYRLRPADDRRICPPPADPPIVFDDSDLTSARANTLAKKNLHLATPNDLTKKVNYYVAVLHQDSVLKFLVSEAFANDELDRADSLMLGEKSESYLRATIGLRTKRGDIAGAQSLLDSIVEDTQDDLWFREIMEINFKIESTDTLYRLSMTEEALLLDIAAAQDSSIMSGYACALLRLCSDSYCEVTPDTASSFTSEHIPLQPDQSFDIYSTRESSQADIRKPNLVTSDIPLEVKVFDLQGRLILTEITESLTEYDLSLRVENSGLYLIHVFQDSIPISIHKVVVVSR